MHRTEYLQGTLHRKDLAADPIQQFLKWYEDAREAGHRDPSAMSLATVDKNGAPHNRMVLLKTVDHRGFIFCTHRDSPKGLDLQSNPRAALTFYWPKIERQVRIEGVARWLSKEENAEFFSARPKGAQIAALLGNQSDAVESRTTMEDGYQEAVAKYEDTAIPPPQAWGGYAITPSLIEFWQGGLHRLHDRFRYSLENNVWRIDRLMP
jgi:pyridoxamine 5'-phosphate oxidase